MKNTELHFKECRLALLDSFLSIPAWKLFADETAELIDCKKSWNQYHRKIALKTHLAGYQFPYMIFTASHQEQVLILGADRVKIALSLYDMACDRIVTAYQRNQYIMRMVKGEFPDMNNDDEVALDFACTIHKPRNGVRYVYDTYNERIRTRIA
jgi:hypothetical protein